MPLTILVTGGAGYVGSHTVLELLNAGHNVVCVDNLCNAYNDTGAALPEALRRVQIITGKNIQFYPTDIRDTAALTEVFKKVSNHTFIHAYTIYVFFFPFIVFVLYWFIALQFSI